VPIYRQIIDQVKYQVATGMLKEGDKVESVRQLAANLAVNQNTILKVYNELSRDNILKIVRGEGTFVSSGKQSISIAERKKALADILRQGAVYAVQLDISLDQAQQLLAKEYEKVNSLRKKSSKE
jgi:GntR family transcriptional regulator